MSVAGGPSKDSSKRQAADAEHASPADHATSCSLLVRQIRARAAATRLIGGNANHAVSTRFEAYIGTVLGARDPALLRFFAGVIAGLLLKEGQERIVVTYKDRYKCVSLAGDGRRVSSPFSRIPQ